MGNCMSINTSGGHRPYTPTARPNSTSQSTGRPSTLNDVEAMETNTPSRFTDSFDRFMAEQMKEINARHTSLLEAALVGKSVDNNVQEAFEFFIDNFCSTTTTHSPPPAPTNPDEPTDRKALTQSIKNHLNATDTSLEQPFKVIKAMNRVNMEDICEGDSFYDVRPNKELHYKACAIAAQDYREAINMFETTKSEIARLEDAIENDESPPRTSLFGCSHSEREVHLKQVQSLSTRLANNYVSMHELYERKALNIILSSPESTTINEA